MSIVKYNDVVLPYAATTQFSQTAKYDDSNTDWYVTDFDISVNAVLHYDYLSLVAPELTTVLTNQNLSPAAIAAYLRSKLLVPRKQLSFTFNGIELIPQRQAGVTGYVDAQNGPKPQFCQINYMGNETFLISYRITASYWEKNLTLNNSQVTSNRPGNPVLHNRWSETVSIDQSNYTKRVREGKYIIRSDNIDGFIADQYRTQMAVVGVPTGFVRESADYTQSPDGLGLQYRIVDKEVLVLPPYPAFEADGEYIESTTHLGAVRWGQVRVALRGEKTPGLVNQVSLIRTAVGVAVSKLKLNGAILGGGGGGNGAIGMLAGITASRFTFLEYAVISRKLYDNYVEVNMKVRMSANSHARIGRIPCINLESIAETPGATITTSPPPHLARGSAGLLLQAAAYYDPSLIDTKVEGGNPTGGDNPVIGNTAWQLSTGKIPGQAGKNP